MFARHKNATFACKVFTVQITDLASILVAKVMSGNLLFVQIVMVCKCLIACMLYACKLLIVQLTVLASIHLAKLKYGSLSFVQIVMVCKCEVCNPPLLQNLMDAVLN